MPKIYIRLRVQLVCKCGSDEFVKAKEKKTVACMQCNKKITSKDINRADLIQNI